MTKPGPDLVDSGLLLAVALSLACGQFLFKRVGLAIRARPLSDAVWTVASMPSIYLALAVYGASTLLWLYVLSRVPLSKAYPWVAIGMVLVPLIGWLGYGEAVRPFFWVGISLVLAGLVLTQV